MLTERAIGALRRELAKAADNTRLRGILAGCYGLLGERQNFLVQVDTLLANQAIRGLPATSRFLLAREFGRFGDIDAAPIMDGMQENDHAE